MPNEEAVEYVDSKYPERTSEWLRRLEAYEEEGHVALTRFDIKDLREVLHRANTVARAAAGERLAIQHLLFNKVDGLQIEANHWAAMLLAESLVDSIKKEGGENYVELQLHGHEDGPILVRIQFKHKKTPAMIAGERQRKIEELEALLEEKEEDIQRLQTSVDALAQMMRSEEKDG